MTPTTATLTTVELARQLRHYETVHFKRVFATLVALCRLTDADIAARTGWSRSTVNGRRVGSAPITVDELFRLAQALRVPEEVFFIEDVGEAVKAAVEHMAWDDEAKALRGVHDDVHELRQYSPTSRILQLIAS
jgi:transcriptional regulator with XRE-family HTH domain